MSKLPNDRLSLGEKPFSKVGVDNFGPIVVRLSKHTRSNQATAKRYGVFFTCLATRAVHLEIVDAMSTDSFILTLRRFNLDEALSTSYDLIMVRISSVQKKCT